jgi:hypothetical protein
VVGLFKPKNLAMTFIALHILLVSSLPLLFFIILLFSSSVFPLNWVGECFFEADFFAGTAMPRT